MSATQCRLANFSPVSCINIKDQSCSVIPTPMLFSNIPLLWKILELVVKDWEQAVTPMQSAIDNASNGNERTLYSLQGFSTLQPHYFKCLFSYAFSFISLQHAYDQFYKELKDLSKPSLRVKRIPKPKLTPYIYKVKMIRDISIAHMDSKKRKPIDVEAATMWQPMTLAKGISESWDLNKMTFGGFKVISHDSLGNIVDQSTDLEIRGIIEMDNQCREYLNKYDSVCAEYLTKIQTKLPITIGNEQYSVLQSVQKNNS